MFLLNAFFLFYQKFRLLNDILEAVFKLTICISYYCKKKKKSKKYSVTWKSKKCYKSNTLLKYPETQSVIEKVLKFSVQKSIGF